MKFIFLLFVCLLSACSPLKEDKSQDIIPKEVFIDILKQVHLTEARTTLNRTNQTQDSISYESIYSKYEVNAHMFRSTLSYYAEKPAVLEEIYTIVLDELSKEKLNLN